MQDYLNTSYVTSLTNSSSSVNNKIKKDIPVFNSDLFDFLRGMDSKQLHQIISKYKDSGKLIQHVIEEAERTLEFLNRKMGAELGKENTNTNHEPTKKHSNRLGYTKVNNKIQNGRDLV